MNTIEIIAGAQCRLKEASEELAIAIVTSTADDPERLDTVRALVLGSGANPVLPVPALNDPMFSCCVDAGDTPMHLAAKQFDRELCELLLELGAKIDARNASKQTPLISAIHHADDEYHERFITWLMQMPGAYDPANATFAYHADLAEFAPPGVPHPLYDLVHRQLYEPVRLMLEAGFPQGRGFMQGNNPLAIAAEKDDSRMVRLLTMHGFQPDEPTPDGFTPLHLACMQDACAAFGALVDAGANIDAQVTHRMNECFGQRPLTMAIRANHPRIVSALLLAGANSEQAMDVAVRAKASADVAQLIYSARHTDCTQEQLNAWLRDAVIHESPSIIEWLVNQGADLNAKHEGRSLLQLAKKNADAIKRLLRSMGLRDRLMGAFSDPESAGPGASPVPAL